MARTGGEGLNRILDTAASTIVGEESVPQLEARYWTSDVNTSSRLDFVWKGHVMAMFLSYQES